MQISLANLSWLIPYIHCITYYHESEVTTLQLECYIIESLQNIIWHHMENYDTEGTANRLKLKQMAAILQTKKCECISFSWQKMLIFCFKFHLNLFKNVQLTVKPLNTGLRPSCYFERPQKWSDTQRSPKLRKFCFRVAVEAQACAFLKPPRSGHAKEAEWRLNHGHGTMAMVAQGLPWL